MPVVTYVNTSADVKAESDICCTSANAVQVVESLGVPEVIFIPDQFLGKYVAGKTTVRLILWQGACEVHERFTGPEIREFRGMHPGIHVMAHPECPPDVLAEADYVGSTSAMIAHVGKLRPRQVAMITECSMAGNVAVEFPEVEFIQPCNLCPHMQRITLPKILRSPRNRSSPRSTYHPTSPGGPASRSSACWPSAAAPPATDRQTGVTHDAISRFDVVVLGAGLGGLSVALRLADAGLLGRRAAQETLG